MPQVHYEIPMTTGALHLTSATLSVPDEVRFGAVQRLVTSVEQVPLWTMLLALGVAVFLGGIVTGHGAEVALSRVLFLAVLVALIELCKRLVVGARHPR
jgi:hypothetical protein